MKSNITVKSNVFNREHPEIRRDPAFLAQVSGRLALQKIKDQCDVLSGVRLSDWQEEMFKNDNGCSKAKNGEMTHGLVRKDGRIIWEGRCEYSQCDSFANCKAAVHYNRAEIKRDESPEQDVTPLEYEWLGIVEGVFQSKSVVEQPPEDIVPPEVVIADVKSFVSQDDFIKIDSPVRIIEAAISSKVLVNAAPGSGKTYAAIGRLEYIIRNNLVDDFSNVLVLVYTNAAKNEILARIESGILNNTLPFSAKNIDICTLDSLATDYLSTLEAQFVDLDYNGRIKLFNAQFQKEDFSNFEYVIVDELQDLVNERAKMALNILGAIQGGYLLLGDKCQAIYDYDSHEADCLNSVEFYKRLETLLPDNVLKFELLGNQRQNNKLAALSEKLRHALLSFEPLEANKLIADKLSHITVKDTVKRYDFHLLTKRTAILCRTNGEAEYVSHLLHEKGVSHTLLRGTEQTITLNRFIADCLWDYCGNVRLTRTAFAERYRARILDDAVKASEAFDALSEAVYNEIMEDIEIDKLAQVLSHPTTKLADALLNRSSPLLTVSTIHKAKGREFETVFLLGNEFKPNFQNTEEARVWYVGCTRAKAELFKLDKPRLFLQRSKTDRQRWLQLKNHPVKWKPEYMLHCRNIVLGLPLDFSEAGFVKGDFATALKMQEYIAQEVHVGDALEIELTDRIYQVRHRENVIGFLSNNMYKQLRKIARESNLKSEAPPYLSSVYVSAIVTLTPSRFPEDVDSYFRETKFWLGVELTGFPQIDWHHNQTETSILNNRPINPYEDWSALK